MVDATATARILHHLGGGGKWDLAETRRAVGEIDAAWPAARRALGRYERFRSRAAEDAVRRGAAVVVFAEAGFPGEDAPHAAAALAGGRAAFVYADASPVVSGQRGRALEGDNRATAIEAGAGEPRGMLRAAGLLGDGGEWLGGGPAHLHLGLAALAMSSAEAAAVAEEYSALLPSGSELVIAVPGGREGAQFAALAGLRPHTVRDLRSWFCSAGLGAGAPVDVRAHGRPALGEGLRADGGRIMAAVAVVP